MMRVSDTSARVIQGATKVTILKRKPPERLNCNVSIASMMRRKMWTYAASITIAGGVPLLLHEAEYVRRLFIMLGIWANRFCGLRAW